MEFQQRLATYLEQHPDFLSCLACLAEELGVTRKRVDDALRRPGPFTFERQYRQCPRCHRAKLVYARERPRTASGARDVQVEDRVRRKVGPADLVGRVIGFTTHEGERLVIVRWADARLAPNPTTEKAITLERVED